MSETISSLWSTLGSLSNRYYVLHGLPDTHHTDYGGEVLEQPTSQVITEATDTEATIAQPFQHSGLGVCSTSAESLDQAYLSERTLSGSSPQEATMEVMRFAKSNRITAKQVKEVGGVGKVTRAREYLLRSPENQMIPELHNEVGKNSVPKAHTVREVDSAQATRRSAAQPLRDFGACKKLKKGSHHKDIQLQRAWQKIAADERRRIQDFARGIRTGSRLGGHLKYGGKKVIETYALSVPVLMTDENMTSKVCLLCFAILRLVKELRLVNGIEKLVTINGAVQCDNPDCESVRTGYARRGRDSNACVNIALAGFTTVLSDDRQPLPPYRRSTRPKGATPSESQSLATGTTQTSSISTMEPFSTVASDAADKLV
ncbi:hypothetical protein BGX24_000569 [Mortierella sp. AD032]|nr:hypothetical protein BGX24_000569 [Mortierella sp. AD032]